MGIRQMTEWWVGTLNVMSLEAEEHQPRKLELHS